MDFSFSDDQQMLTDLVQRYCAETFGPERARSAIVDGHAATESHWKEFADLGWIGLAIPESLGGGGGTMVDACIVAEALAQHVAPVGFVGQAIVAPAALHLGGLHEDLAECLSGAPYALATGSDLAWPAGSSTARLWEARPGAKAITVDNGRLAVATVGEVRDTPTADPLRRLPFAPNIPVGGPPQDPQVRDRLLATALTATASALVGTMAGALKASVSHAGLREQFGQPIGSFQAVQHMCAEMLVDLEASRSAAYGAAWAVDDAEPGEALRLAAATRLWCGRAAIRVCETAIQVHGGIGYTWEGAPHLYLRQARVGAEAFADARALSRYVTAAMTADAHT